MLSGVPAGMALAAPMITGVPSIAVSCLRSNCGDDTVIAPSFFAMNTGCSNLAGKLWLNVTLPVVTGNVPPISIGVLPGGNGPLTLTRGPALDAIGDDPCITPTPTTPLGISNSK